MKIRKAKLKDLSEINEIYNQAVRMKFSTADISEIKMKDRKKWFSKHFSVSFPVFVCENKNKIIGWVSISPYREGREALRKTVEISYYVHKEHKRKGVATAMITHMVDYCRNPNYKNIFAIILEENKASIQLLSKLNFKKWGYLPGVAEFDGVECGHEYWGLRIK